MPTNIPIGFNSDGQYSPMSDGDTDFERYEDEPEYDEEDECE